MTFRWAVFWVAGALLAPGLPVSAAEAVDPAYLAITDCPEAPGCPAIMLLEEVELDNDGPRTNYTVRRVTKLFTQDGIDNFADVQMESKVGQWDVRDLTGRTILPNGSVLELATSQISSKTLKRGKHYVVIKSAKFPGVVPGAIVEYSFKIVTPPYVKMADAYWYPQKEIPVLKSQFKLKPGEWEMAWKQLGSEKISIKQSSPTKKSMLFTAERVPALPDEPYGPPDEALQAMVYFCKTSMQTEGLAEYSTRIAATAGDFIWDSDPIQKKAGELAAGAEAPLDKVKKIYAFVQEKIATEEMRPEAERAGASNASDAAAILARGWGDEWERTLLFLSLTRAAGLEQALLLITGRFSAALDPNAPELAGFDSFAAAVKIGPNWTFYDPATRHCPFGMVASEKENGAFNALIVSPRRLPPGNRDDQIDRILHSGGAGGFRIAAVPFSASSRNVLTREAVVKLPGDGSAVADVTEQGTGLADVDIRDRYETEDDEGRSKALLEQIQRMQADAELVSSNFDTIASFESPAVLKYQMKLPGFASQVGDRIVIVPSLLDAYRANPFTAETRRTSVSLPYCKRTFSKIRIAIPEGFAVEELPPIVAIRETPFTLTMSAGEEDGNLTLTRRLEIETARVSVEDYPKLREFFRKVQEADKRPVVLKKKS